MSTSQARTEKAPPAKMVTTATGRILRVNPDGTIPGAAPTAAPAAKTAAVDPARRPDVLLRVRHPEGHEISSWWMIAAFLGTSGLVIALLSWVPYNA